MILPKSNEQSFAFFCLLNNVDFNILLRLYMDDRFLERLSKSKYRDNFVLKGGFYLSTLFGVENRAIMDIDTAFRLELDLNYNSKYLNIEGYILYK